MRNTLAFLLIIFTWQGFTQVPECAVRKIDSVILVQDTNFQSRKAASELIQSSSHNADLDSLWLFARDVQMDNFLIPVVIHCIGCSISQLTGQMIVLQLNNVYKNQHKGPGVDTQIQFCLAQTDPEGESTSGITENMQSGTQGPFCIQDDATIKSFAGWDRDRYLNIWLCNLSSGCERSWGTRPSMFYSTSPGPNKFRDGVVFDIGQVQFIQNSRKSLAHAVGHYLDLIHTFGEDINAPCGSLGNEDFCFDTPYCLGPNNAAIQTSGFCGPQLLQCSNITNNKIRQIENYMDDSDVSCKSMFTLEQKNRMQTCLNNMRPFLNDKFSLIARCTKPPCAKNGIQDGEELGIDCGGPSCDKCPTCAPTLNFKINGQTTTSGDFIHVCNDGNIIVEAAPLVNTCQDPVFITTYIWACHDEPMQDGIQGANCEGSCCEYRLFRLSVQECDENKNLIGVEMKGWMTILMNAKFTWFNLDQYLAKINVSLQNGKMYKVKYASLNGNPKKWSEASAYIKLYTPNLTLTGQTSINHYADKVYITGCTVNNSKTAASTEIMITAESKLVSGQYYIANYNCYQLPNFRIASTLYDSTRAEPSRKGQDLNDIDPVISRVPTYFISDSEALSLSIMPNPTSGQFSVSISGDLRIQKFIFIVDGFGRTVYQSSPFSVNECVIDGGSLNEGVYSVIVFAGTRHATRRLLVKK